MAKSKYKLLNKYENRVIFTNSEVEKNILLDRGFHIDETWGKEEKQTPKSPTTPKRRKAVSNVEGKTKD